MGRYSVYVKTNSGLYKVPFDLGNGIKENFDLEELDNYFAEQKDYNSFLKDKVKENPTKIFIGYIYNKEIKAKPIILNDLFIKNAANSYLKAKKENKRNLYIPKSDSINAFVDSIRKMAIKDNDAFNSMFMDRSFPKHVYDVLNDYRNALKKEDYSSKISDLEELKNQIDYNIRKYNYFRSIYLWRERFLNRSEKQENDYKYDIGLMDWANRNKQKTNTDIEEEVNNDEEIKVEKVENPLSVEEMLTKKDYEDAYKILEQYKSTYAFEISDPKINQLFKEGGLASVLYNCDIEEIERLTNEEKEYIGYKTNKKGR